MTNRVFRFFCAFVLVGPLALLAQTTTHIYPGASWESYASPDEAGYSGDKIQELARYVIDEMHTTGLVVVVGGKILGQFGDVEELSYLASCRKSILAMLYGKYVEEGSIDLEKASRALVCPSAADL